MLRRSPRFLPLLAAQTISPLGDAMATTALILHLQRTHGTGTAVGLLLFAQAVPPLASPVTGTIADRIRPDRLVPIGFAIQGVLAAVLAVHLPDLVPLLAVVFLLALVDTPLNASVGRCVPLVVADADLPAANALRGGVRELGAVIGPPIAGLLFAATDSPRLVLAIDAVTFLVAIPLVLRPPRPRTAEPRSFASDVREGLGFVWRTPSVRAVAIGFWFMVLCTAPDDLILPFLATVTFGAGP